MTWKPIEVVAISPESRAVTALRGQRKMLPPKHFRKPAHCFIDLHILFLKHEPPAVYQLLGGYALMKNAIIAGSMVATVLIAGCGEKPSSNSATPPPAAATQSSSPVVQSSDTSDPYPGSGGLFLGTPDRKDVDSGRINFTPERFVSFKIGSTTKAQVTALLGKPAGWLTETNGTSQLEYDYVEPGGASDLRKIIYVFFTFDDKRVLTRLTYPDYDSDKHN